MASGCVVMKSGSIKKDLFEKKGSARIRRDDDDDDSQRIYGAHGRKIFPSASVRVERKRFPSRRR